MCQGVCCQGNVASPREEGWIHCCCVVEERCQDIGQGYMLQPTPGVCVYVCVCVCVCMHACLRNSGCVPTHYQPCFDLPEETTSHSTMSQFSQFDIPFALPEPEGFAKLALMVLFFQACEDSRSVHCYRDWSEC